MVLNEPETSLHPELLPALGRLIAEASRRCAGHRGVARASTCRHARQEPHPAHPQQDLLHDAHGVVAAIDPAGQVAVMHGVFGAVGVQQIDGGPPDVDLQAWK